MRIGIDLGGTKIELIALGEGGAALLREAGGAVGWREAWQPWLWALGVAVAWFLSVAASWVPCVMAAGADPAEVLRADE